MKKNYLKLAFLGMALTFGAKVFAEVVPPTFPTQTPEDGGKYVLASYANPSACFSRTSWDGAYYLLSKDASNYATHAFTLKAEEGRWLLITGETQHDAVEADPDNGIEAQEAYTSYTYVGVPSGTDNLNGNLTEEAYWLITPGTKSGFYYLTADDGQGNTNTIGMNLHLNSGAQYLVVSEKTNYWYPDFCGGFKYEEDGETPLVETDDLGFTIYQMADSTSMNWALVKVEDVPSFLACANAWTLVKNYESTYCSVADYGTSFTATLNNVMPLYTKEGFSDEDYKTLSARLQAKINLYDQIQKAIDMDPTALAADIAAATEVFNGTDDSAETLNAALTQLESACTRYSMGQSDITSLGKNMSFEDLTAQNGSESSSIATAPTGWNVYVDGTQMEAGSTDLVKDFNWHGVNSDCSGYKDGNVGFGIWAVSVPDYEISQTISGLDNGTYTITAGLMVATERRTTQRLFGNLNSTLFGAQDGYKTDILPTEYKTFADLEETNTESQMQELSVRAYVYDGTLRFGIKTDGDYKAALRITGNSGDGWFKVDNFTITKEGFIPEDQETLYNYLSDKLNDLAQQPMDARYATKYTSVEYADKDEAIPALVPLITEAQQQVDAYTTLNDALEETANRLADCEDVGYDGVDDFSDVYDQVFNNYESGAYSADEISDAIAVLEAAYQECLRSSVNEGADVSGLIINRSFEDLSAQGNKVSDGTQAAPAGWELYINDVKCETAEELNANGINGWCAINSGDGINQTDEYGTVHTHQYTEGTHLWGIWNTAMPAVRLQQTLTGLTPGTYLLTADVMVDGLNWAGNCLTTQRIFAQDAVCLYGSESDYQVENFEGTTADDIYQAYQRTVVQQEFLDENEAYDYLNYAGWNATGEQNLLLRTLTLHFGVDESGVATIGFATDGLDPETGLTKSGSGMGWFKVDNFTLYFESSRLPTRIESAESATLPVASSAIYDLSGRRVQQMQKGVYIQNGRKLLK